MATSAPVPTSLSQNPPPGAFDSTCPEAWNAWSLEFESFRQDSGLSSQSDQEQINTLRFFMGKRNKDVFGSMPLTSEDIEKYDKVKEAFDLYFSNEKNVISERAQFNQRCQGAHETVDSFIDALHRLVRYCRYGGLEDEMIRDRLVVGLLDKQLSQRLQSDPDLTLASAVSRAREREAERHQKQLVADSTLRDSMGSSHSIEAHRLPGLFIARGEEDALMTLSIAPGEAVYGEKRIVIQEGQDKTEYRAWGGFHSRLAAAILLGISDIHIRPGSEVLYLGAAKGTAVSHVADIVGLEGLVYAVDISNSSACDLLDVAKKRKNIIPILADARHPDKYRMQVGKVDTIVVDVGQSNGVKILATNAQHFLKDHGHFILAVKAGCIDASTDAAEVFAGEVKKLRAAGLKPEEQVTLEPYGVDQAVITGTYITPAEGKKADKMKGEEHG